MYRRTQAFCETKLPCSHTRQQGRAVHIPSREHISLQIPKDKLYEAKLPIAADNAVRCTLQRGGHVETGTVDRL